MSTPEKTDSTSGASRSIPVKYVVAGVAVLALVVLSFFAGVAYENNRIKSAFTDAFGGDTSDSGDGGDFIDEDGGDSGDDSGFTDPVELVQGNPLVETVDEDGDGTDEGEYTITLLKTVPHDEPGASETLDRGLDYYVKIENTGEVPVEAGLSGHYETDEGEVLEFAGVGCQDHELPEDTIKPGQFVQGCSSHDLPDAAGRLVFDEEGTPPFFIKVPAAS